MISKSVRRKRRNQRRIVERAADLLLAFTYADVARGVLLRTFPHLKEMVNRVLEVRGR